MLLAEKRILAVDNILIHRFDNEAVLLNLNNEMYYSLNITGYTMWQTLTTSNSVAEALAMLAKQYDIEPQVLEADIETFIEQLLKMELIEVQP